ncbi:MAG: 30S ribosomal protein S16 [Candidatus Nomurabacteria bacterium]|nr:MAG: 30S ribosomal protein S16 [Candidatus Nomurabacteria bacterium]
MMRLQRVGRKNDPSYRIVVVDKRTGPKSNKHVDHLGSYNPKLNHVQLDGEKAKHWLSQGVQPSDTVYNILVSNKVIEGKKKNVLPKKSPIIDEAKLKAEAEAKEKAEAEAKAAAEASEAEEVKEEESAEAEAKTEEEVAPATAA